MSTIFFSHGTADYPIVEAFKNELEQMKSEVYLFEHDRQPNQDVTNKVQKNIDRADIVTVLLTKQSQHSAYVHQEIGYAERAGKPILPLVETGTDPNLLAMLTGREYIPFDPNNPYRSLSALQTFIHNHEREALYAGAATVAAIIILALIVAYYMKR